MIRFRDAFVVAQTKLRTHRIRTGFAIATASLLFGLIAAVVMVTQGAFDSIGRFSNEGLNNRTIVSISKYSQEMMFNEYDARYEESFIAEVDAEHKSIVAKKVASAKKYSVSYDPAIEDPSPIGKDPSTKQRYVDDMGISSKATQNVAAKRREAGHKPFDVNAYLSPYPSARVIQDFKPVIVPDGALIYMKNGKETIDQKSSQKAYEEYDSDTPSLMIIDSSLTAPFITSTSFDPQSGEIPAVVPYSAAAKALGYEPLSGTATSEDQLARLSEVRERISEVKVSFCYRNAASMLLLDQAVSQRDEMKQNVGNADYVAPRVQYAVPNDTDCGSVAVVRDVRTAEEKQSDANRVLYEKEIGEYIGDPVQMKVNVRGVGVSGDAQTGASGWSAAEFVKSLLGSSLGYGTWSVPTDLFAQVPQSFRPDAVFSTSNEADTTWGFGAEEYLVEFGERSEARRLMQDAGMFGGNMIGEVVASPFGSGVLLVEEAQSFVSEVLKWMLIVVGAIAVIILGAVIGRTVSEGRKESAIFRAIGAKRSDIAAIYGMYVGLLALLVVAVSGLMATVAASIVEILYWQDATVGARLSYAASTTSIEFHLISFGSVYLLYIVSAIAAVTLIASVIPIFLGARRNPIKDMRDDA